MLHALELENFKAFGKRARIPFAPITLIFGENSSGKSSILQALNLLKQTRESRETEALLLPRSENGIVDLGSFKELLFDHDLKRTLSIRIETQIYLQLAIEFSFKMPSLAEEVLLDQIRIFSNKSAKCIAKFKPSGKFRPSTQIVENEEYFRRSNFFFNPFIREKREYFPSRIPTLECVWMTKAEEYWKQEYKWCKENREDIVNLLKEEKSELEDYLGGYIKRQKETDGGNELKRSKEEFLESQKEMTEELKDLSEKIQFFLSNFNLIDYIYMRHTNEMKTVLGLQGFLPAAVMARDNITHAMSYIPHQSPDSLDLGHLVVQAGFAIERTLETLFPMGPFRRPPERWYIFTGTSPKDVGYRGDQLPDLLFRQSKLVHETNEWLQKLDIGYELDVIPVNTDAGDLFEVILIDTRRKERIHVALPDVGFGISQLLPFIVQSLVSKKQIISIEQPEVHVHPKLQADLGDLLAEAIQKPRQNQFIIETHSEHLILRLQRLVFEKKIRPEDVSVIYVSRGPEGAKAERLRLDDEGDFIDEWPNGFFLERLRELR